MSGREILFLLVSVFSAAGGQLLMRIGAKGREGLLDFINPWLIGGLGLYAASTILWILVLSKRGLTLVYPFTALTIVLVYTLAIVFQGESLSAGKITGSLCIVAGLTCFYLTAR